MVKSEAQHYLELPAAPMNTDQLEWCTANEINFPELSVMARQYKNVRGFKNAAAAAAA
jgi:hypothetical protein